MTIPDLPVTTLPADYPRIPSAECQLAYFTRSFSSSQDHLRIFAAFLCLLRRHTDSSDLVILSDSGTIFVNELSLEDTLENVSAKAKRALAAPIQAKDDRHIGFFFSQSDITALDLNIIVSSTQLKIGYDPRLFAHARIEFFVDQLVVCLSVDVKTKIGYISLVTENQKSVLPNPCADLDWAGWKGAITDVFSSHAQATPERVCVVQSEESFTYGQILQYSNALAQHLLNNGIQPGQENVVVVWAHRSVELVVAAMGVLKAGAIFCVVDPTYPPIRQATYLRIAQPRALIVIGHTGSLHSEVRDYIDQELPSLIEVPHFVVDSKGVYSGINALVEDCMTRVVLGPDSIATLSFTSGSTGVPKGVKGRHHSLTFFFPWMAERFGLDANSRFAMLSGIAHDPIQRDIFTPLFLGGALYIPSSNDIHTPGQLASWIQQRHITTTCLTPGMVQILCSSSSQVVSTLTNAFITGDILPKRTLSLLQTVAPHARAINMYGSTETQRAVSFWAIAPARPLPIHNRPISVDVEIHPDVELRRQKDIIPAGIGMRGVQLLVVNRLDRTLLCGVGEVGEIYLRSGAMAEGYLHPTAERKYWENWFAHPKDIILGQSAGGGKWLGPRDRLYRSGDLGRYLADGTVECSGRADNLVKIRGYRVELGEVDTCMNACEGVREGVTVVRTMPGEDQKILVGYYVGNTSEKDVRDHLKAHLAAGSIPSYIFTLPCMPLNPNGKIDKPNLPWPPQNTTILTSSSTVEQKIQSIFMSLLPNYPGTLSESFFDLGGHSILATQLLFKLKEAFDVDIGMDRLMNQSSVAELALLIEGRAVRSNQDMYGEDFDRLVTRLASSYPCVIMHEKTKTVLLTGATGFLGSYILRELVRHSKVICLVREPSRLRSLPTWNNRWLVDGKVEVIQGDLGKEKFGLSDAEWGRMEKEVDVVVANGAVVHWVHPYSTLRNANVLSTLDSISLCATPEKPKSIVFISSTSVFDTQHYANSKCVPESDDLEGARMGLPNGYSQTKWVSEKLLMEAGKRGLKGTIVRACYVLGDTLEGISNTDDFIWRMVKGSIQLGYAPRVDNALNAVSVDWVGRVVSSAITSNSPPSILQLCAPHLPTFTSIFAQLLSLGFSFELVDFSDWREKLAEHVKNNDSELYPLLHMVLDPAYVEKSKAPPLAFDNVYALSELQDWSLSEEVFKKYFSWLVAVGYLPREGCFSNSNQVRSVNEVGRRGV